MRHNRFCERIMLVAVFVVAIGLGVEAAQLVRVQSLTIGVANNTTTVTTSATAIPTTNLGGRESIAIRLNDTTDTVYVGDSSVTTANGFTLDSSVPAITIDLDDSVQLYAIAASGTVDIRTFEAK